MRKTEAGTHVGNEISITKDRSLTKSLGFSWYLLFESILSKELRGLNLVRIRNQNYCVETSPFLNTIDNHCNGFDVPDQDLDKMNLVGTTTCISSNIFAFHTAPKYPPVAFWARGSTAKYASISSGL